MLGIPNSCSQSRRIDFHENRITHRRSVVIGSIGTGVGLGAHADAIEILNTPSHAFAARGSPISEAE